MKKSQIKQVILLLIISFTFLITSCVNNTNSTGTVLATVGSIKITDEDVTNRYNEMPESYRQTAALEDNKSVILNQLINEAILLNAAKEQGYENHQDYKNQISSIENRVKNLKEETLINLLLRDKLQVEQVTEEEITESYKANRQLFAPYQLRRISHIVVPTREEAITVQRKALNGENFANLAKQYSKDVTAQNGGEIGWVRDGQIQLAEFNDAIFNLKRKGSISKIVKTDLGFHVIRLDDVRDVPEQKLEDVKNQIKQSIANYKQTESIKNLVDQLKQSVKIKNNLSTADTTQKAEASSQTN